jgi:hypothetical protein
MRLALCLSIAALLTGCEPKGPYPLTFDKILAQEKALPGEVVLVEGEKQGVFKAGPGTVGNENTAGHFRVVNIDEHQGAVKWPATPGYYYEVHSYQNLATGTLYVMRKIPAK